MSYRPPPNPPSQDYQSSAPRHEQDNLSQKPQPHYVPALTGEEIKALKECNMESFYYRCVPLSALLTGLAYIGMKNGYLNKSPRFGYTPKMLTGALIGYIGGKLSYQSACAQKIMKIPNSSLADTLRKRKGLPSLQESFSNEPGFSYETPLDFQKDKLTVEERRPDLSDHDEGIDSYNTVKESLSPYTENEEAWKQQKSASYNELRRENRKEYFNKLSDKYKAPQPDRSNDYSPPPPSFPGGGYSSGSSDINRRSFDDYGPKAESGPSSKQEPYFNPKKNKYGDTWDD